MLINEMLQIKFQDECVHRSKIIQKISHFRIICRFKVEDLFDNLRSIAIYVLNNVKLLNR